MFSIFDIDGSNNVSRSEILLCFSLAATGMAEEKKAGILKTLKDEFKLFDDDGDGRLNFLEFKCFLNRNPFIMQQVLGIRRTLRIVDEGTLRKAAKASDRERKEDSDDSDKESYSGPSPKGNIFKSNSGIAVKRKKTKKKSKKR